MTDDVFAADGRVIGSRALVTRRKLLDATAKLLQEQGILDLRVVDISRDVGSSPATFYQYFNDVDEAILELAKEAGLPVQVHTPHRNKKQGTEKSMAIALEHGIAPEMVIIDHNNEETVKQVLDQGFYAAFTIYPFTKMGNERMVEIVKQYGSDRIMVNSAADWGISDPLAVPKTAALMKIKGIAEEDIRKVTYQNAIDAFIQSGQIRLEDFENPSSIDQSQTFNGNTILRGGQQPRINKNDLLIR